MKHSRTTASELRFDLRILTENGTESVTKVCSYNLHPDSKIWTWGYTSAEYFEIYGEFKWYWDGAAIVREWAPSEHPRHVRGPTERTRFKISDWPPDTTRPLTGIAFYNDPDVLWRQKDGDAQNI